MYQPGHNRFLVEDPAAELVELCRELVLGRGLPVLLVSGHTDPALIDAGLAAGARGFVPKPFRPSELLAAVDGAVATP